MSWRVCNVRRDHIPEILQRRTICWFVSEALPYQISNLMAIPGRSPVALFANQQVFIDLFVAVALPTYKNASIVECRRCAEIINCTIDEKVPHHRACVRCQEVH